MRITPTSASPMESSYEIIWAPERRPPSRDQWLFEAQPANTMPYTAMEPMARNMTTPASKFAMTRSTW